MFHDFDSTTLDQDLQFIEPLKDREESDHKKHKKGYVRSAFRGVGNALFSKTFATTNTPFDSKDESHELFEDDGTRKLASENSSTVEKEGRKISEQEFINDIDPRQVSIQILRYQKKFLGEGQYLIEINFKN